MDCTMKHLTNNKGEKMKGKDKFTEAEISKLKMLIQK